MENKITKKEAFKKIYNDINVFLNNMFRFRCSKKNTNYVLYLLIIAFVLTLSLFRINVELTYISYFFNNFITKPYLVYYIFFIPFLYFIIDSVKNKRIKPNIPDFFILLYLLFCIVSTILSSDHYNPIFGKDGRKEGLIVIITYIMIYFNCKRFEKKDIIKLIRFLFYVVIFQSVLGIVQVSFRILGRWGVMASGLCGNPNFFGSFNCLFCLLATCLYIFEKKDKLYLITAIFSYIGLLLAESSGPFFSFALILFVILIYVFKNKEKLKKYMILLTIFVLSFPVIQVGNRYIDYKFHGATFVMPFIYNDIEYIAKKGLEIIGYDIPSFSNKIQDYDIATGRSWIWRGGVDIFKEHPFFGTGLETFQVYSPDLRYLADKAHNNYLEILCATGIYSLVCYLGYLITLVYYSFKKKNNILTSLTFAHLAYGIQIAMNISSVLVAPYYYIISGFMASLSTKES